MSDISRWKLHLSHLGKKPSEQQRKHMSEAQKRRKQYPLGHRVKTIDGYYLVKTIDGYISEHRVIIENSLGRKLRRSEVVHHKDGDISNNQLENLELLDSQSVHMKKHNLTWHDMRNISGRECNDCGSKTSYFDKHDNCYLWTKVDEQFICNKCYMKRYRLERKKEK